MDDQRWIGWRSAFRVSIWVGLLSAWMWVMVVAQPGVARQASSSPAFNFAEALQKSIFFYDAQRSGQLPERGRDPGQNRVEFRGDSGLDDGADNSVDLVGGFYDAGDHVKFGFPMAGSTTLLAWSLVEYRQGFSDSGQLSYILDNLRWANDYFVKAHTAPNVLYGQVGLGSSDHNFWGAAEVMPMDRPSFRISESCPGSDLAAETAAAMAASAIAFEPTDPTYSDELIEHAEQLYAFADKYRGAYSDCITDAQSYYRSWSGYMDELIWGALWLYRATGDGAYLEKAESYMAGQGRPYVWTHSWDDKTYGSYILLVQSTGASSYRQDAERWLNYWTVGTDGARVTYTPGGLAWLDAWGPLRYSATTAFLAFVYSDWLEMNRGSSDLISRYRNFAQSQVNYILGQNPLDRSFLVGFGQNPAATPHHRSSHGSWSNSISEPSAQRHSLFGALVGGPDANDQYSDDRSNYVTNEVALDYNAGLVGALARMVMFYGGTPLENFPPSESRDDNETYIQASVNASGSNFTEIKALVVNKSGWPARSLNDAKFRYFFTLESGVSASSLTISSGYAQCKVASSAKLYSGNIYYLETDCSDLSIYPGGQSDYVKEVQFRITSPGAWDASNDWSMVGVASQGNSPAKVSNITLYDAGVLIWGTEPDGSYVEEPVLEQDGDATPAPAEPEQTTERGALFCGVDYLVTDDWSSGFVATVNITNLSGSAITDWVLEFDFSGSQLISSAWNGIASQSSTNVEVLDADWNASISDGATVSFGFVASYSGTNSYPTTFTLNGMLCGEVTPEVADAESSGSSDDQGSSDATPVPDANDSHDEDAPDSTPTPEATPEPDAMGCSSTIS